MTSSLLFQSLLDDSLDLEVSVVLGFDEEDRDRCQCADGLLNECDMANVTKVGVGMMGKEGRGRGAAGNFVIFWNCG